MMLGDNKSYQNMSTNTNRAINAIRGTSGRYFGLRTTTETVNARLLSETPSTILVEDRNAGRVRRFRKSSIRNVTFEGYSYNR